VHREDVASRIAAAVRFKNPNQKARRRFPGAGFEILAMVKIYR
jgi:hypothetical protein